jgi:hypothetical protein
MKDYLISIEGCNSVDSDNNEDIGHIHKKKKMNSLNYS